MAAEAAGSPPAPGAAGAAAGPAPVVPNSCWAWAGVRSCFSTSFLTIIAAVIGVVAWAICLRRLSRSGVETNFSRCRAESNCSVDIMALSVTGCGEKLFSVVSGQSSVSSDP